MRTALIFLAAAVAAPLASAQTTVPFNMRVQLAGQVSVQNDGSTVAFQADGIGLPLSGTVTIQYLTTTPGASANITGATLVGSTDFSLGAPELPVTLSSTPGATSVNLTVGFQPSTSRLVTGRIQFTYVEGTRTGSFSLNLTGSAPEFAYTYQVLPNGNSSLLNQGATIAFPQTSIAETSSVAVVLTNKGTAPGLVNKVALSGDPEFALAGLPFLPVSVDAGKTLAFNVRFTADQLDPVNGAVTIEFVAGRSLSFKVTGSGLGPVFEYEVIRDGKATAVEPNATIDLPDALVGEKSSLVIRVWNTGNAEGRIAAIAATGTGFTVSEVPFTPYPLTAGNSITFSVNFSPTQPGKALGKLRVGADSFDVAANALGAQLVYSYMAGNSSVTLQSGGSIVFPPVSVGGNSSVQVAVTNNGTARTAINSISATGPVTSTFVLTNVPSLPVEIPAGRTVQFTATFAPTTVGNISGSLRIDTLTFPLSGVANAPAALPNYTFDGSTGAVDAAQQPSVGLSLSSTYPLALNGTLTLAFNSEVFSTDPAVQFATGGKTVNFTIPAGARQAVFPGTTPNQIKLQTGTVAGAITLTPTFATATGAIDLTPTNPLSVTLTVPQKAPVLQSVALSAKTTSGFTLLVTGYATGRSVTQMDFQFTPTANETVSTTKVTLNVEPSFIAWYSSTASQAYGSMFTATIPFTLQGDVNKVTSVVDTIQSVSVTLTNRQGTSTAKSVDLR